jgi:hypothetical protein
MLTGKVEVLRVKTVTMMVVVKKKTKKNPGKHKKIRKFYGFSDSKEELSISDGKSTCDWLCYMLRK